MNLGGDLLTTAIPQNRERTRKLAPPAKNGAALLIKNNSVETQPPVVPPRTTPIARRRSMWTLLPPRSGNKSTILPPKKNTKTVKTTEDKLDGQLDVGVGDISCFCCYGRKREASTGEEA